ncbi:DUF7305 domain-containing protein [Dehalococcoides mccartyi]|uniref:DUF7305 domain-containing protein n=1 Tax=Dehalococcoides mccartyi (strain ATCC BAA-2266 / KCTC 15142 / 195) TaxID=243164 RepID=Q3Z6T2_DEHM1|nr:hypothetical protein [Dehalococcoides mccartyi]AAW39398.1 hypothetical protein DET1356 [Dehalococcoides mccartyi 195]
MISMKKLIKGEKGASLAIALIFLAIGAIMLPPLLMLIGSGLQQGTAIEERTAGIYDSDAGVEWAINLIKTGGEGVTDSDGNIGLPNQDSPRRYILSALNGDTLEVKLTYHNVGSYYEVVSKASLNGKSITTRATLKYQLGGSGLFDNAITSLDGDVIIKNNTTVSSFPNMDNGNIIANGDIIVGSSANIDIEGSATASGTITGGVGNIEQGYFPNTAINTSTLDTSLFMLEAMSAADGTIKIASAYNSGGTINGDTHLIGNLSISSNKTLTVNENLYIEGSFTTTSNSTFNFGGTALYVSGNLDFKSNSHINFTNPAGCLVYVAGSMTVSSNNTFNGPLTFIANGNLTLNSNTDCLLTPNQRPPLIISETGTVIIDSNVDIIGIVYAPNGHLELSANTDITGCVIAQSITMNSNSSITFRTDWNLSALDPYLNGNSVELKILTWDTQTVLGG